MRTLAALILALVVLSSPMLAQAGLLDPSAEARTIKTEHFTIHFTKELEPLIADFAQIAERVHARLSPKYKWQPWGRTHLVLVDKTDQANGLATVIPANYILLFLTPPEADSSLDNYRNYLELLFTHEYTHILHIDQHHRMADPFHWVLGKIVAPNGLTPGWMREGIAAWEETVGTGRGRGNSSYSDLLLRTAVLSNDFPALDEASGLGNRWPGSDLQYIYGVRFWRWLAEKYGEDRIQRYAEEYSSGLWLFSLNNKARRVFNKSFYELWREWRAELETHYRGVQEELTRQGLTPFEPMAEHREDQLSYPTFHPTAGYAYSQAGNDEAAKIVIHSKPGAEPAAIKRSTVGQLAFSRDGKLLAYSSLAGVEPYTTYGEVYTYDLASKKSTRVRDKDQKDESLRAMDPDFSPKEGGSRYLVLVRSDMGTDDLYLYDLKEEKGARLTQSPRFTQFSNPRFSPDGSRIVVSRKDHGGNRDLFVYDGSGRELQRLTDDAANDNHPVWSPQGDAIYYSSDRTGIPNIYRHGLGGGAPVRVTNVLTGVYQPSLSPDGKTLAAKYYRKKGADLYRVDVAGLGSFSSEAPEQMGAVALGGTNLLGDLNAPFSAFGGTGFSGTDSSPTAPELKSKKYNPFPQFLVPRFIVPTFTTLDDSFLFGLSTGGFDPLYRHQWSLFTDYRSDAKFVGGGASYVYARYNPSFFAGVVRYALNWGNLFGTGQDFFEERLQGYVGSSLALGHHNVSLSYFYENRDAFSTVPAVASPPIFDRNAGLRALYTYARYKFFPDSISQEDGPFFKLSVEVTDEVLGSAEVNEQQVVTGDFRYYLELPWADHHVLALRTAAGWVWGDRDQIGASFRFGGPFGEGTLAGYSNRLFPFRGLPGVTFARDRVLLFSTEYRIPLATVERGIGTWPVFLKKAHMALFTDYGDSWARNGKDNVGFFDDFLMSVGAEFKGDFVIGYGLPVTGRLGYGIIIVNRDRIRGFGLKDSLFGMDAENGNVYLQFGTSF